MDIGAVIVILNASITAQDPNGSQTIHFNEGDFLAHDVADFGFLDLVRLGVVAPNDPNVAASLAPSAAASDGNSTVQVTMPSRDIYFHRYNHDSYGESNGDCTGWPSSPNAANRYGRFWPVLSGERGEYEIANGRPANLYLQSMADAANDGYFLPEQVWDRPDIACFTVGRPTGSAAPLNWAEGQYLRLAHSIDAGYNLDTPSVVKAEVSRRRSNSRRCRQVHRRRGREHRQRDCDPALRLQRDSRPELVLEQPRRHAPRAQQVFGRHWRRDCQRNAASALGLQRHSRSGMALATTDPTREPAVWPLLECRRWKRRRRREA